MIAKASRQGTRQLVAELLWRGEVLSRAQIARRLSTSKTMVSNVVDDFLHRSLVIEDPKIVKGRGRAAVPLRINAEMGLIFGVDLGASNVRINVATLDGVTVKRVKTTTPHGLEGKELAKHIFHLQSCVAREARPKAQIISAVFGLPGVVNGGLVSHSPNLPCIEGVGFTAEITRLFDKPVQFHNDVNLAAYAEVARQDLRGNTVVLLSIGTGLGVGIVHRGNVWQGAHGRAGEIGYLPFESPVGSILEQTLSGTGLAKLLEHFGGKASSHEALTSTEASAEQARGWFRRALTLALTAISATIDPDKIIVGGGVGRALGAHLQHWFYESQRDGVMVPVEISTLSGNEEEMGAIALARSIAFDGLFEAG